MTTKLDPGPKICDQDLSFLLHPIWTCFTRMILVMREYSSQIKIDIDFNNWQWRVCEKLQF